jgi:ABC-type multidrug transport system ATPase subunit
MFGNFKAVNKVKFSIKQGEVFAILGHNGAGKTTLINMLTGMTSCSGGDARIYGNSILTDIEAIQREIGLC